MVGLAEQIARMDAAPPPPDIGLGLSDYRVAVEGRASWITVTAQTGTVDLGAAPFVDIGLSGLSNLGLEGLSWDQRRKELVLAQEMLPVRVLVVGGLDGRSGIAA
jgi:uncharacterized protein YjiK